MQGFNKKNGFTLIEVLIALFILSTTVFILSSVQMRSYLRIERSRAKMRRLFLVKKELYKLFLTPPKKDQAPVQVNYEGGRFQIESDRKEISDGSQLKVFKEQASVVSSRGQFQADDGRTRELQMVSFVVPPPEEEEKK